MSWPPDHLFPKPTGDLSQESTPQPPRAEVWLRYKGGTWWRATTEAEYGIRIAIHQHDPSAEGWAVAIVAPHAVG